MHVGVRYFNDCPVERYIPIFLIAGGAVALYEDSSVLLQSVFLRRSKNRGGSKSRKDSTDPVEEQEDLEHRQLWSGQADAADPDHHDTVIPGKLTQLN